MRVNVACKDSRFYPYPATLLYQCGVSPGQDAALVQCASSSAIEGIAGSILQSNKKIFAVFVVYKITPLLSES